MNDQTPGNAKAITAGSTVGFIGALATSVVGYLHYFKHIDVDATTALAWATVVATMSTSIMTWFVPHQVGTPKS